MIRLIVFVAAVLLVVPAYGQCGLRGRAAARSGNSCEGYTLSYGGCGSATSYGESSYGYSPITYSYAPATYGYSVMYSDSCGCGAISSAQQSTTTSSPVQKLEPESQETPLPPDYFDVPDKDAPVEIEEKQEAPMESFTSVSLIMRPVSIKTGDAILMLYVSPTAQVWINGSSTQQVGSVRKFMSYGLIEGRNYKYNVRVNDNGHISNGVAVLTAGQTKVMR